MPPCPEIPGHTLHLIQRGYLQGECFFSNSDRIVYLKLLDEEAHRTGCAIHAYVLMSNHVHLLLTPSRVGGVAALMHSLKARYTCQVRASGHDEPSHPVWEADFRAAPVFPNRYVLSAMRYIESNPIRARVAAQPEVFRWSSHRFYALGEANSLLTPHSAYAALARDAIERQARYRSLFNLRPGGARRRGRGGTPAI